MKITAEFNSNEELVSFISTFGAKAFKPEVGGSNTKAPVKEVSTTSKEKDKKSASVVDAEIVSEDPLKGNIVDAEIVSDKNDSEGEAPKITKEMVREIFSKIIKLGKQKEAKELTTKYGASKLPDVKEEDYAAIYKEAEGLL